MTDRFDLENLFQDYYYELIEYYGDNKELAYEEATSTTGFFASSSICATILRRFYKEFPEERTNCRKCFVDDAYELNEIHKQYDR